MSVQNKPDYKIFADGAKPGEVVPFPDVLRGWGITLDTTGGIPPMEFFNSFGKRLNEWLLYLTQRGVAEWDVSVDYPVHAMVLYGGVFFVAIKQSKGDNPSSSQNSWTSLENYIGVTGKFDKTGGTITAKGKAVEIKMTDDAGATYMQLTGKDGTKYHQIGKLGASGDFEIYNDIDKSSLKLNASGISFNGNETALKKDTFNINSNLSDIKDKSSARSNLGLGAAAVMAASMAKAESSGYIQIPSIINGVEKNVIIQWMSVYLNQATGKNMYSKHVNWPTPFPAECLCTMSSLEGVDYDLDYNPVTSTKIIDRTKVEVGSGYKASASTAFVWGVGY